MKVKIIGCGLIGTSIALGLKRAGYELWLEDSSPRNLQLARDLIGNDKSEPDEFDLIVVATPLRSILSVLKNLNKSNINTTVIEVGGLKSKVIHQVEQLSDLAKNFVSVHPMAGREVAGPGSARADLFSGRAWLITPTSKSSDHAVSVAISIGKTLGATTYRIAADEHDAAIAAISHMPQLVSSALALTLLDSPDQILNFAGQGLRDVTRLADSDSELWTDLILNNSEELVSRLRDLTSILKSLEKSIESGDAKAINEFFVNAKAGRAKIPGKHGAHSRKYSYLPIVIADKPGQLAKIFDECAQCNVNIEDLSIEHSPEQETGLVTLALNDSDAIKLSRHMREKGWLAQEIHK